jgi:hypothetical protein
MTEPRTYAISLVFVVPPRLDGALTDVDTILAVAGEALHDLQLSLQREGYTLRGGQVEAFPAAALEPQDDDWDASLRVTPLFLVPARAVVDDDYFPPF